MKQKALFVAAGTGGHLYPALATAKTLVAAGNWDVTFAVRRKDMGKTLLEREGFSVIELSGQGMPRSFTWKWLTFPFKVLWGFWRAYFELKRLNPVVVVGWGGYLSFSVLLIAKVQRRRAMIHEQNVLPGLTNKFLSRWVDRCALSFSESLPYFKNCPAAVSGLPVRSDVGVISKSDASSHFSLDPNKITFLFFGGSLGATRLNHAVVEAWPRLSDLWGQFQVIHVTGKKDFALIEKAYKPYTFKALLMEYCHDMAQAIAAADFIVCRAGASTIAELCVAQKPALLIPYPYASENHQLFNAEVLVKRAAAEVLFDQDVSAESVAMRLRKILKNPERVAQMKKQFPDELKILHSHASRALSDTISNLSRS